MRPPTPLRPLGPEGQRCWRRVWSSHAHWLDRHSDRDAVQLLAESMDERETLRIIVDADPGKWRERIALRSMDRQVASQLAALGLDPQARKSLTPATPKDVGRLAELRAVRNVDAG